MYSFDQPFPLLKQKSPHYFQLYLVNPRIQCWIMSGSVWHLLFACSPKGRPIYFVQSTVHIIVLEHHCSKPCFFVFFCCSYTDNAVSKAPLEIVSCPVAFPKVSRAWPMTAENPVQNPAHEAKHGTEEEGGSSNLSKVNMDPTPGILIIEILLYIQI